MLSRSYCRANKESLQSYPNEYANRKSTEAPFRPISGNLFVRRTCLIARPFELGYNLLQSVIDGIYIFHFALIAWLLRRFKSARKRIRVAGVVVVAWVTVGVHIHEVRGVRQVRRPLPPIVGGDNQQQRYRL